MLSDIEIAQQAEMQKFGKLLLDFPLKKMI